MNLVTLGDHTVDMDAIGKAMPYVLDIGSRGSEFKKQFLRHLPLARVYEVDPDTNLNAIHVAIVGAGEVTQTYARFSSGEGNHLGSGYGIADASPIGVPCMTIAGLSAVLDVPIWDVVKLDCEGAEFGILENWPGACFARQISVEFHDAFDRSRWNDEYFTWLFSRLRRFGYKVISHPKYRTTPDDESSEGHWDTLLSRVSL